MGKRLGINDWEGELTGGVLDFPFGSIGIVSGGLAMARPRRCTSNGLESVFLQPLPISALALEFGLSVPS